MVSVFLPTSRVFTSGYVNTETILHFFTDKPQKIFKNDYYNSSGKLYKIRSSTGQYMYLIQ